jgi:hypothetical protein
MQPQAPAYASQYQDPSQQQPAAGTYQDQMIPPATDQAMMQGQANAPVAPVNPYAGMLTYLMLVVILTEGATLP